MSGTMRGGKASEPRLPEIIAVIIVTMQDYSFKDFGSTWSWVSKRGRVPAIGSHRDPAYDLLCTPSDLFQLDHHGKLI
jgi:hypothetical protein